MDITVQQATLQAIIEEEAEYSEVYGLVGRTRNQWLPSREDMIYESCLTDVEQERV